MGSRTGFVVVVSAAFAGAAACGGSARDVADPFSHGFPAASVVLDRVTCQPSPDMCGRVVVLRPVGIPQTDLIHRVEVHLAAALHWRPTRYREVVETDEGDAFDGRTSRDGGWVDAVQPELRFWSRTGWAQEVPPDRDELALLTAARATPDGVVVSIARSPGKSE